MQAGGSPKDCPPKKYTDATLGHYKPHSTQTSPYDDSQSKNFGSSNSQANVVPHPPQIYSLAFKTPGDSNSGYTWGTANHFTVNSQDSGIINGGSGSFTAVLRFFAYADNDQMPLTRMAVDWGDGTAAAPNVYTVKGWFKNRKPYCDTGDYKVCGDGKFYNTPCSNNSPDCVSIGGQCQPAKDDPNTSITEHTGLYFGNSSSACDTGYYEFKHVYTCSGSTDPHWNGTACSFTPKVQVLDNWGWCNGTCQSISGTTGCWDDSTLLKTDPPHPENQACSIDNPVTANQHWTNFGGTINVTP